MRGRVAGASTGTWREFLAAKTGPRVLGSERRLVFVLADMSGFHLS